MTSRERIQRMFDHKEADHVPILDILWEGTLLRWEAEGMPANVDWRDYFGIDKLTFILPDLTPRYETKIVEETRDYVISTTQWGITLKNFKVRDSTPEFLDYKVNTPKAWEEAKARMKPSRDRVNWAWLKENYPKWKAEGHWIEGHFWFGYDAIHSWMSGMETILIAMLEDPEWFIDMNNTMLELSIATMDMIWDEGYTFDAIFWPDDMGYKSHTFFSNDLYAELCQAAHKRAIDWAHNHGIKARLHSCGYIMPRIPQLVDIGLDGLNPIEIKAGMDLKALKRDYGEKLCFHGGANAMLMDKSDQIIPFIEDMIPVVKENGGYIFSSDHSIPNSVSLETYKKIVETVKKVGAYS
jgi:uroporphyrinogen decarboxylase